MEVIRIINDTICLANPFLFASNNLLTQSNWLNKTKSLTCPLPKAKKIITHLLKIVHLRVALLLLYTDVVNAQDTSSPLFITYDKGRIATDGGYTRGVGWGDVDQDGFPELYTTNSSGQWNAIYKNNGKGSLTKITTGKSFSELINLGGSSEGISWVDYDNDGDLDLYLCSRGKEANQLFQNNNTHFIQIENHALVSDSLSTSMACWSDYDLDGDLDVFLIGYRHNGNVFYENIGEGNFQALTNHPLSEGQGNARTCACGDANGDRMAEIFVGNAQQPNFYYRNLGNLNFEKVAEGPIVEDLGYAYGSSWADYDDDGDLDLFIANFDKENLLFANDGSGHLEPLKTGILVSEKKGASKGHAWGDYDNDGDLDLYIGNGTYGPDMTNFLYLNNGVGDFERYLKGEAMALADTTAGVAHADYDRDGDLDLFVANWGSLDQINRFYINQTFGNNWVSFRLKGTHSNTYGIGTKLVLYTHQEDKVKVMHRWMYPITGYASQNDYELHFGLGEITVIDSVIVTWPSGIIDKCHRPDVNTHWLLEENDLIKKIK